MTWALEHLITLTVDTPWGRFGVGIGDALILWLLLALLIPRRSLKGAE